LGFCTPGIFFGTMGVTPVAATTTSGFFSSTSSLVTVVFRKTGTCSFSSSRTCQRRKAVISPFPGGMEAIRYWPPAQRSLSYTSTWWPHSAAAMAACMPAGPAPTTITFLGCSAGTVWYSGSLS